MAKKKTKSGGDAFAHLEKFTSLQMVGLFIPSLEIEVEQRQANKKPYFRASCVYQGKSPDKFVILKTDYRILILLGETVSAIQQTKKKAKQALCTKLIKKFKLLDLYRGEGASERLDIGAHTEEMEIVLDDGDTKMEVKFQ